MLLQDMLLFAAGFVGGIVNAVAGGGSFITFPALLMAGVPAISANATNTFASLAGYLSGTVAFRRELASLGTDLRGMALLSLAGGSIGALLLLRTPERAFAEAVPWLLLAATLLFAFGSQLGAFMRRVAAGHARAGTLASIGLGLLLLLVAVYGGFFNAGLGILTLAWLALFGQTDLNVMNGAKLLISSLVSTVAVLLFAWNDAIAWREGALVMIGSLAGGYLAAALSRRLPQTWLRAIILVAAAGITLYFFFVRVYAGG